MTPYQRNLLDQLANDLISGELEVDTFLFTRFFQDRDHYKNQSGTVGCPLGHWARKDDEWTISDDDIPYVRSLYDDRPMDMVDPIEHASSYFGVLYHIAEFMFIPHDVLNETFGYELKRICEENDLHYLEDKPEPKPVGENIRMILDMEVDQLTWLEMEIYHA